MLYAEHKILIQQLVDNQLFDNLFDQLKHEVATDMIKEDDTSKLLSFRNDIRALDRLKGKLFEIANELRMVDYAGRK